MSLMAAPEKPLFVIQKLVAIIVISKLFGIHIEQFSFLNILHREFLIEHI